MEIDKILSRQNADGSSRNLKPEWRVILDMLEKFDLVLLNRIIRRMFIHLYRNNVTEVLDLMAELEPTEDSNASRLYANIPFPKIERSRLRSILDRVFHVAGENLPNSEITRLMTIWLSQERSRFLSITMENSNVSLAEVKDALSRFFTIPRHELHMSPNDFMNIRVSLIRRFLSSHLPYINIAKHYITVRDFHGISKKVIGPGKGNGRLGGKSAGVVLAHRVLKNVKRNYPELSNVQFPQSWFIASDTTMDFIHYNALEEITGLKYMDTEQIRAGYPILKQMFKNSFFPGEIIEQLTFMLEEIGERPIICRSSSLLEDSFEATFAGKYKSLFLPNTGSFEKRLGALLDAVSEIMASVFGPDPIEYRKRKRLLDFSEQMGILVQEVIGHKIGKYFFPTFAGVAFSLNEFRWTPRIDRKDGMVRLVAGLGTRAVDRLTSDYPFLGSPGKPGLRVNQTYMDQVKYSQKYIDVLNLETGSFESVEMESLFKQYGDGIKGLENVVSIDTGGHLKPPMSALWDPASSEMVITFQGLTENTHFMKQMNTILNVLAKAFDAPVDVEFASDGENIYILQCRPQGSWDEEQNISIPLNLPEESVFFRTDKYITPGFVNDIRYLVYVDAQEYGNLPDIESMQKIGEVISVLNDTLPPRSFILMGPGRWGSRGDIKLGVPVTYSDISNTLMLIEVAEKKGDYVPDLSFGTHFFQDLVESNIRYLPIYPDDEGNCFNRKLCFDNNSLSTVLPRYREYSHVVSVVDVGTVFPGSKAQVIMNSDENIALGIIVES
ncbi:MAG: pyruvate, phosphate dikinase [Deltaproteobacteria bacterium]|nr:pyruvate, phosphate dikinase [Deltaproteobacteria bacterium]